MKEYSFKAEKYIEEFRGIIPLLLEVNDLTPKRVESIIKKFPKDKSEVFSRDQLISGIRYFIDKNILIDKYSNTSLEELIPKLKMKPTRTISGVTTVTVLTKPFACPGKCIFCPNDVRMPKSYIATEPGAQRALMNRFSPYFQVYNRLKAIDSIGHPTEKIELLILGGTWSYYPKNYQIWFIKECFRAMNDFGLKKYVDTDNSSIDASILREYLKRDYNDELRNETGDKPYNQLIQSTKFKKDFSEYIVEEKYNDKTLKNLWDELIIEQDINSKSISRCVGLVLETRPDSITPQESFDLRRLGATKIQLGIQTLNDDISDANERGERKDSVINAFKYLRMAGFKIHAHMMPNLFRATLEDDLNSFKELFDSEYFKPDELKIYPTSVIKYTKLDEYFNSGEYIPYTTEELIDLISDLMEYTPKYCRITRVIRDIPSTEIEGGNKTTNLREVVEHKLKKQFRKNENIRAREIGLDKVKFSDLSLDIFKYSTTNSIEYFLQFITLENKIAGFLRLSIPNININEVTSELNDCAIIREVHVYGPSLELDSKSIGEAQHLGLGSKLIDKAKELTMSHNFNKLAVISSIGTREYYDKRGFKLDKYYQICDV